MKKVIMEMDDTCNVYGPDGWMVGMANASKPHFGDAQGGSDVKDIIKLKDAGFTATDIVELKEGGLL